MRVTLDIDDDVLAAVEKRALDERRSAGEVISDLTRRSLAGVDAEDGASRSQSMVTGAGLGGFRPFPSRGNALRDAEGI